MARKLKVYQTSIGFFDMVIAAPSMKAALLAWGADSNLFHQGFAKEAANPDVVAAAMSHPGVILKRPVGSSGAFKEHASVPAHMASESGGNRRSAKRQRKSPHPTGRKAALAFERQQAQRDRERKKQETARTKAHERRRAAVAKAQAAIDRATREHDKKAEAIDAERAALDQRSLAEDERWRKEMEKLETLLRRARG